MDNITELKRLAEKLIKLLDDPHPGLHTWRTLCQQLLDEISTYKAWDKGCQKC